MKQFQIVVEHKDRRVFATDWVTGRDVAEPLAMLIASKFPPPYLVLVSAREVDIQAQPWDEFVMHDAAA